MQRINGDRINSSSTYFSFESSGLVTSPFILGPSIYVEGIISLCYGVFGFTKNVFGLKKILLSFSV